MSHQYLWQKGAMSCEVCGSIGNIGREQRQIKKIGLCFTCSPNRPEPRKSRTACPLGEIGEDLKRDDCSTYADFSSAPRLRPEDFDE